MTDQTFFIAREALHSVFGDMRVVRQFETLQERVAASSETVTANVEKTEALEDATFLTLSANAALPNERVLVLGEGLSFDTATEGQVKISASVVATGGHLVQFSSAGPATLALPIAGIVATTSNTETLENKTLDAPSITGLGDYADDTAAAAGGVPVDGIYRNGSVLQVRVA